MKFKINLVRKTDAKGLKPALREKILEAFDEWMLGCRIFLGGFSAALCDQVPVRVHLRGGSSGERRDILELSFMESTLSIFERLQLRLAWGAVALVAGLSFMGLYADSVNAIGKNEAPARNAIPCNQPESASLQKLAMDCPPIVLATGCSPIFSEHKLLALAAGRDNFIFQAAAHTNTVPTSTLFPHQNGSPWGNFPPTGHSNFPWVNHSNIPGENRPIPHTNIVPGEYIY